MGTLIRIAFRNVVRHKARTIISALVMTFGIAVFIFFDSALKGMDRITIDTMIDFSSSSVKLRTPGYKADERAFPLDKGVPDADAAADRVESTLRGSRATARGRFIGSLSNWTDEIPVAVTAVDPRRDGSVFPVGGHMASGSWLSASDGAANALVLGSELALELGVKVGDLIVISAQTAWENRNADEFSVVGIVNLPDPLINRGGAFVSRQAADRLLGSAGFATEIDVALPKATALERTLADAADAAASLGKTFPALDADPIGVLAEGYLAMRNMKSKFSSIMIFMVLLIAGVGIANTILMSMYSRIREIGVLRAYGMTPRDIKRLFTFEGLIIGLFGGTCGVALGCALNWFMVEYGVSLDALIGKMDLGEIPLGGTLHGEWSLSTIVFAFAFGIVVAWISASVPARRASKLEVTNALRFV
ncbi:MAG: FtsX-like permease family protein [Spirochaetes bacterium]|nr:FtsX-like permease family protein [Spirochaetota bacterium]